MLRLISATPSPYARKVRIALHEKAIAFELVTEVPWNHDASVPRFNPLGRIPVLLLNDGSAYNRVELHHRIP
jgi:glutathione S-transferase